MRLMWSACPLCRRVYEIDVVCLSVVQESVADNSPFSIEDVLKHSKPASPTTPSRSAASGKLIDASNLPTYPITKQEITTERGK